jgi:hypothetical protein
MKVAWIGGVFVLVGALIQGLPAWIPLWRQSPNTSPSTSGNASTVSASVISVESMRDKILLAPDPVAAEIILREFWYEGHSGFHTDDHYDPAGCPAQGYGVAWNVHYDNRFFRDRVLVFSTPQDFTMLPNEGGWYAQVCLHPGVTLSADDVGKLQAAFLQKKHQGRWSYEPAN